MYVYTCMYIKIHMYVYKNTHVQKYIYISKICRSETTSSMRGVPWWASCEACRVSSTDTTRDQTPMVPKGAEQCQIANGHLNIHFMYIIVYTCLYLCLLLCLLLLLYLFIYINLSQYYSILIPSHHGVFNSILGTPRPSSRAHFSPHPGAARARTSTKLFAIPMCSYKWGSAGFGFIKTVYPLVNIQKTMENHYFW